MQLLQGVVLCCFLKHSSVFCIIFVYLKDKELNLGVDKFNQ